MMEFAAGHCCPFWAPPNADSKTKCPPLFTVGMATVYLRRP